MGDLRERLVSVVEAQIKLLNLDLDHVHITESILNFGFTELTAHLLEASDLEQAGLPKLAARMMTKQIIRHFRHETGEGSTVSQEASDELANPRSPCQSQPGTSRTQTTVQEETVRESLFPQFKLNWKRIYDIKEKSFFEKGGKIRPDLRRKIVSECVGQIMKSPQDFKRDVMEKVYQQLSHKYPRSFLKKLASGKTIVDSGFVKQMKDTFDNTKRPHRNNLFRNPTKSQYEKPAGKFAYGCSRWRVLREITDENTEEMMVSKQKYMKKTFRDTRPNRWDWNEILIAIELTYEKQRNMINSNIESALEEERVQRARKRRLPLEDQDEEEQDNPCNSTKVVLEDILSAWPFLFTYEGMKKHFQLLTDADAHDLTIFAEKEGENMIGFFKILKAQRTTEEIYKRTLSRMKRKLKTEGCNEIDIRFKAVIIMASHYMGENSEDFILACDDINAIELLDDHLRQYPGIIAEGTDLFESQTYHISADSRAICTSTSFVQSVAITFMLYYVLNMNYSPSVCATLEFLQRNAFGICPTAGHKRPTEYLGKKMPTSEIHPKVNKLTKAVSDSILSSSSDSE